MIEKHTLESLLNDYKALCIDQQIDYTKFYLYSMITHSTAIEGSTVTELENQLLFDEGIAVANHPVVEQLMNLDLKSAYEESFRLAKKHCNIDIPMLKHLSSLVMKNTGSEYRTALGDFDSSKGDLRLLNVSAGVGGPSYLSYQKIPAQLEQFCQWLNAKRSQLRDASIFEIYQTSFEAHFYLVSIHPWADGNGRMARLLMNHLQAEFNVLPSIVLKKHKAEYIQALQNSRDNDNPSVFFQFMTEEHAANVQAEIDKYKQSIEKDVVIKSSIDVVINAKERQILNLIKGDCTLTTARLAEQMSLTPRQVQRLLASLKQKQLIRHEGSNKKGKWVAMSNE